MKKSLVVVAIAVAALVLFGIGWLGSPAQSPPPPTTPPPTTTPPGGLIERYGRVEYYDPMALDRVYPLKIDLTEEKREIPEPGLGIMVAMGGISFLAEEEEPLVTVEPYSVALKIVPERRDVLLERGKDVSVEFDVLPLYAIDNARIHVEFFYKNVLVAKVTTDPITIREKDYQLDGIQITHETWRMMTLISGAISLIDATCSLGPIARKVRSRVKLMRTHVLLIIGIVGLAVAVALFATGSRRTFLTL